MALPRLPTNFKATWTGSGTGNLVGLSAADGFSWLGAAQDGLIVGYEIINVDQLSGGISAERELGFGQWTDSTSTLSRADGPGSPTQVGVIGGTNGTNRVDFTNGETKLVSIVSLGDLLEVLFAALGHVHAASDVTSGTFDEARIPDLSATYQPRDGDLDDWAGKTAPSGTVVGTTDAQTLTQKVLQDYTETVQALGNISGTVAVNYASGSIATGTLTGDVTSLSFTNMDVGATITLVLSLGGNSLADPSTTQWPGGVQPDIGTGKVVVSYTKETSAPLYLAFLGGGDRA